MNKTNIQFFFSDRDIPLIYYCDKDQPLSVPVITVENYLKWYDLYVIFQDKNIIKIGFSELEKYCGIESPYCGYVPNPIAVSRMADVLGYHICSESMEMIIGRWEQHYFEHYDGC